MNDIMNVSVCIPTYNQAPYIEQAIRSAFNQSCRPSEIIVSDDCSTDDTMAVLQRLATEIPVLKIIAQPFNLGISKNTDFCLRAASGEFILRLDSDDYILHDYILKLGKALIDEPKAGYAHAAVQEVDKDGNFLKQRRLARKPGFQDSESAIKAAVKGYRVAANIIMFRKKALETVGFITATTNFAEDYYLSAALAVAGFGNIYIDEILCCYRVWLDSGKVRQKRKLTEIIGVRKVFEEVLEPAFTKHNWANGPLKSRRASFVCAHAICLTWDIYTKEDKAELVAEFYKVSTAPKAKLFVWAYLHNLGWALNIYIRIIGFPKSFIKSLLVFFRSK